MSIEQNNTAAVSFTRLANLENVSATFKQVGLEKYECHIGGAANIVVEIGKSGTYWYAECRKTDPICGLGNSPHRAWINYINSIHEYHKF